MFCSVGFVVVLPHFIIALSVSFRLMALLMIRKTALFTSPPRRFFSPCHNNILLPYLLSLPPNADTNLNLHLQHRFSSVTPQFLHQDGHHQVARDLLDIFSKPPDLRADEELRGLGPKLTPEAVEAALRDLDCWRRSHELFRWASWQDGFCHNCYTYNAMASVLSRARRKGPLQALAVEVVSRRGLMTPGALGFLIRCLGDQGLVEEAGYVFDQAGMLNCVPNAYTYNCLLEALAKVGKVDLVESRVREMVSLGMKLDKYTLTPILKAYCNASKLEDALEVFSKICSKGWADEHVFTTLLVWLCKWGEVDRTCELVERMVDVNMRVNLKTFCVLIHGFVRERRVDKALMMFEKMKVYGFTGDLAIYGALIDGILEGKELRKALHFFWEMKKNGIFPDVRLVTRMISKFCGEGDFITANWLLEEEGEKLDFRSLVLLYNALLDGLVSHGDVEGAHSLIRVMMESQESQAAEEKLDECGSSYSVVCEQFRIKKAVHPNPDSFTIVVCGLCKAQKLDMALSLVNDMVGIGCKGKVLMYNDLISELCNVNRLEESLELLKKMKEFGFEPTQFTHNSIFGCLCKREDLLAAIDLLREMRHHGHVPWIKHCTMLVQQLCKHGKVEEACKFLDDMVEVGFLPDMIAYSAAIDGLCKIRNVDQALKVFRDVSAGWYLPDVVAHNILINGFCNAGRVMEAREILNEMLEKGMVPSVVTYNIMMNAWCKEDSIDVALDCFSKLIDEDARPPTVVTYTILINGFFNSGRPDDALAYWNKMREKGCAPNKIAYTALIHGLCKCGMEVTALFYFREMEKEFEPDISVYLMLLSTMTLKGDSHSALGILKEMLQKANIPSPVGKSYQLLKDAVSKMYEDVRTSSDVSKLIEEGGIKVIPSVDVIRENLKKL